MECIHLGCSHKVYHIGQKLQCLFNRFKPNGIPPPLSIRTIHFCWVVILIFIQIICKNNLQANSEDPDQTPRSAASGLRLRYWPTSHKKDARQVKEDISIDILGCEQ